MFCLVQCLVHSEQSLNGIIEKPTLRNNISFALFPGVYAGKIQRKRPNVATI